MSPALSPADIVLPAGESLLQDRLSELVAYLSGSPAVVARDAVECAMESADAATADALHHVAAALVRLRRSEQRALVGAGA